MSRQKRGPPPPIFIPEDCNEKVLYRIRSVGANEDLEIVPDKNFGAEDAGNDFSFFTRTIPPSLLPITEQKTPLEQHFSSQLNFTSHLLNDCADNIINIEHSTWPRTIDYTDLYTLRTSQYLGDQSFKGENEINKI